MNVQEEREGFQDWLGVMDVVLQRFLRRFPEETRRKLDFSPPSLDVLEEWLLRTYPTIAALRAESEKDVWDEVARYIGETYLRELGGYWEIRLDDPKYAYYAVPQITGFSKRPTPECPHMLATTAIDRKRGNFISTLLRKTKEHESNRK